MGKQRTAGRMTGQKIRARKAASAWRQTVDGPVVFTNGVFDILHAGHVKLIEEARACGAALVVGINDDESVRRLGKGLDRPIVPARSRARVLAALEAVDCVVLFPERTPVRLIDALAPDVLVKGADYQTGEIPGRVAVEAAGGRVVTVALEEGQSTTALIERIRAST